MNSNLIARDMSGMAPSAPATTLPQVRLDAGREGLLAYFQNTWALTETLFSSLLSSEAYYLRPYHRLRHPLIFYYAHPVTFYINKLQVAGLLDQPLNPHFETLFETGVDEMAWDDLHEGETGLWPAVEEVVAYRKQVYELVAELIMTHPLLEHPITMDSAGWALVMCFEHERIHLETSSVLIRELPLRHLVQPEQWPGSLRSTRASEKFVAPRAGRDYPLNKLIEVTAQSVQAGKPQEFPTFGWDNEYGERRYEVPPFRASQMLISNGEFYEFVCSGGYLEQKYWSSDGWQWRGFRNSRWPSFWVQDGPVGTHRYRLRTLFALEAMQWDWPAIVNYYEASAYCAWRTEREGAAAPYRLLREEEHLALRSATSGAEDGNCNLRFGSESPVNAFAANEHGFNDVFGNVWQWSEDSFKPLPGFRIHPYYVDFSVPCFDDRHQMLFGGSFISTGDESSHMARFHFRPHFFQHAGFRMVQTLQGEGRGDGYDDGQKDSQQDGQEDGKYETDGVLDQYLLFHWGSLEEQRDAELQHSCRFPDPAGEHDLFPLAVSRILTQFASQRRRALDLGCAVGRASFELARHFDEVGGVDNSSKFIGAACHMQEAGRISFRRHESGRHFTPVNASADPSIERQRISFHVGDACRLGEVKACAQPFDAVLLSNLLCRLPDPAGCLAQFVGADSLLAPGGVLTIASPNSWLEAYTPQAAWLDGTDNTAAADAIGALLPGFELIHQQDLPFLIREHRRKYEYIISQVTVWRKRL